MPILPPAAKVVASRVNISLTAEDVRRIELLRRELGVRTVTELVRMGLRQLQRQLGVPAATDDATGAG
jgi:hypothetical protein